MIDIQNKMCSDSTVNYLVSNGHFYGDESKCSFVTKFDNHTLDIDGDDDDDLIMNLYETKYGRHGIGILENNNGHLELNEIFHLYGDAGYIEVGDFDGNGYIDIHSTPTNYHGEGRFDGFLPEFYNGHIVHPNLFVFRNEDGFYIDTLISSDPSNTHEDFVMGGYIQQSYDLDNNGTDDLVSSNGGNSLIYKWSSESSNMIPIDTMSTNNESKVISAINIFDTNNDGSVDLVYTINNKFTWEYEYWVFHGNNGSFDLDNPSLILNGFNDSKNYDDLDSKIIDIDNDGQMELIKFIGKNIDDNSYYSTQIRVYSFGDNPQDITEDYFPNEFNTNWGRVIGNGLDVVDLNNDGLDDILFDDTFNYDNDLHTDFIINNGNGFDFTNVDEIKSGTVYIDLFNNGYKEILYFDLFTFITLEEQTNTLTETEVINNFTLKQNYPNPFNSSTIISFELERSDNVELSLFDISGRKVKVITNTFYNKGEYSIQLDMGELPSGVYFYTLKNSQNILTKSLTLIK